jgi:hypothetical protein
MTSNRTHRWLLVAATALGCLFGCAEPASSQIFLPPKGQGEVSVVVQQGLIIYHLIPDHEYDRGSTRWQTVSADVTYGLGERIGVSLTLPWVRSVYRGVNPHCLENLSPCPTAKVGLDDQSYHGVIQDIHASLLYALKNRGVTITPFVGAIIPSHDYPYFNHSAAGRRLFEVEAGVGVARLLDPVLPDAYIQARFAFGRPQHVLGMSHNRSTLAVEAGYVIKNFLQVFATADGQYTHGGIDFHLDSRTTLPWETWSHHDQIGREHHLIVGFGTSVSATESLSLFASVVRTIAGHNGHEIDYLLSMGVTRTFGRPSGHTSEGK